VLRIPAKLARQVFHAPSISLTHFLSRYFFTNNDSIGARRRALGFRPDRLFALRATSVRARSITEKRVTKLGDTASEQAKNLEIIAALAQETRRPLDEVRRVYEGELARLKSNASITDYVALFASRSTKKRLAQGESPPAKD
jgi:hypothetical protein